MFGTRLREAAIVFIVCNIFVGGQDLLEYYKPKPGLPKELNAWLANVQRHERDFRLIRAIAENPTKFGLSLEDDEEVNNDEQLLDNLEEEYLDYGPTNDIYPHVYKNKNVHPNSSPEKETIAPSDHKNQQLRLRRHSDTDSFFEKRHDIAINPKSTNGEVKRSDDKYPDRYSNSMDKRDIQIDVLNDGKLVKQIRDPEQDPKSIVLNIQAPDQILSGFKEPSIESAGVRAVEKNDIKAQLFDTPLKIYTPRNTIDLDSLTAKNKEYSSNFKNLFYANENLNTDSSIARDNLARTALVYRVTLPDPNFVYQPPSDTPATVSTGSFNNNGFKDMSHFWTVSEKNQLQKGIDFAQDLWDRRLPPSPQKQVDNDGFELVKSVVVDTDSLLNKQKAIVNGQSNINNPPNKRESETLEGHVDLCPGGKCTGVVHVDDIDVDEGGRKAQFEVRSDVIEKVPQVTTSIAFIDVESEVETFGDEAKPMEVGHQMPTAGEVGDFGLPGEEVISKEEEVSESFSETEEPGEEFKEEVRTEEEKPDDLVLDINQDTFPVSNSPEPEHEPPPETAELEPQSIDELNPPDISVGNIEPHHDINVEISKNGFPIVCAEHVEEKHKKHHHHSPLIKIHQLDQHIDNHISVTRIESVTVLEGKEVKHLNEERQHIHGESPTHDEHHVHIDIPLNPIHGEHHEHIASEEEHPSNGEHCADEEHFPHAEKPLHAEHHVHIASEEEHGHGEFPAHEEHHIHEEINLNGEHFANDEHFPHAEHHVHMASEEENGHGEFPAHEEHHIHEEINLNGEHFANDDHFPHAEHHVHMASEEEHGHGEFPAHEEHHLHEENPLKEEHCGNEEHSPHAEHNVHIADEEHFDHENHGVHEEHHLHEGHLLGEEHSGHEHGHHKYHHQYEEHPILEEQLLVEEHNSVDEEMPVHEEHHGVKEHPQPIEETYEHFAVQEYPVHEAHHLHGEHHVHEEVLDENMAQAGGHEEKANECVTDLAGSDFQDLPERQGRGDSRDSDNSVVGEYPNPPPERSFQRSGDFNSKIIGGQKQRSQSRLQPKPKFVPSIQYRGPADVMSSRIQKYRSNNSPNSVRHCENGNCGESANIPESERNLGNVHNLADRSESSHQIVHDRKLHKHKKKYTKKKHRSKARDWPNDKEFEDYPTYSRRQLKSVEYVYDVDLDSPKKEHFEENIIATTKRTEAIHKNSVEGDYGDEEDSITSKRKKGGSKLVKKTDNAFADPVTTTTEAEDDEEYYDEISNVADKAGRKKETSSAKQGLHSKDEKLVGFGRHLHKKMKPPKKDEKPKDADENDEKNREVSVTVVSDLKSAQNNKLREPRNLPNQRFLENSEFQQWPQFVRNDQINEENLRKKSSNKRTPLKNIFPLASKDYFQKSEPKRSEKVTPVDTGGGVTEKTFVLNNNKNTKDVIDEKFTISLILQDKNKDNVDDLSLFPATTRGLPGAETGTSPTADECESTKVKATNVCEENENFNKTKVSLTTVLSIVPESQEEINNGTFNGTFVTEEFERLDEILNGHLPLRIFDSIYNHVMQYKKLKDRFSKTMKTPQPKEAFEGLQDMTKDESRKLVAAMASIMSRLQLTTTCQTLPPKLLRYLKSVTRVRVEDVLAKTREMEEVEFDDAQNQNNFIFQSNTRGDNLEGKVRVLKDLLVKFNRLPERCKARAEPVREYIENHLGMLSNMLASGPDMFASRPKKTIPERSEQVHHEATTRANERQQKDDLVEMQLESLGLGKRHNFKPHFDLDELIEHNKLTADSSATEKPIKKNKRESDANGESDSIRDPDSKREISEKYGRLMDAVEKKRSKRRVAETFGRLSVDDYNGVSGRREVRDSFESPVVYSF